MSDTNETINSIEVLGDYNEIFEVELEGWCFGLQHFTGQIHKAVVYRVIKELQVAFNEAVTHQYIFDIIDVSSRISRAAKYAVEEQDIAFCILSLLPEPAVLDEVQQTVLFQIVDKVDQVYGGALDRMQRKWSGDTSPIHEETEQEEVSSEESHDEEEYSEESYEASDAEQEIAAEIAEDRAAQELAASEAGEDKEAA